MSATAALLRHDQPTHELRQIDHRLGVGATLFVIAVQNARRGAALQDPGELPGQVRRVAQSRDQPLTDERGRDVRRVAGEKHPTLAEGLGGAGVKAIDGLAFDRHGRRTAPGLEQLAHASLAFHVRPRLSTPEHEFPALAPAGRGHVRSGPPVVAEELHMVDRIFRAEGVDDQPILGVGLSRERLPDELADEGTRAVRADEIASAHGAQPAFAGVEGRNDGVGALVKSDQGDAERGVNLAVLRRAAPQRGFELGLVKRHEFGMPVNVAERVDPTELAELRRQHPHIGNRDLVEIAVLESGQLQNSERLVVQRDGPRRHEDVFVFVHRQDAHPVPSQEIDDRRADRPVADHQNVDVGGNVRRGRRIGGLGAIGDLCMRSLQIRIHRLLSSRSPRRSFVDRPPGLPWSVLQSRWRTGLTIIAHRCSILSRGVQK